MLPINAPATAKTLAANVNLLIDALPQVSGGRPMLAARMGIGDKTLGILKAGTGNPTLESIEKAAKFFRKEPWELLKPTKPESLASAIDELAKLTTPRSRAALQSIQAAAEQGALTEADLLLLQRIADRFIDR